MIICFYMPKSVGFHAGKRLLVCMSSGKNYVCAYFGDYVREHNEKSRKRKSKKNNGNHEPLLPEEIFFAKMNDHNWMSTLAYLVDIFTHLNVVNLQTQGREMNVFIFWNKIERCRVVLYKSCAFRIWDTNPYVLCFYVRTYRATIRLYVWDVSKWVSVMWR